MKDEIKTALKRFGRAQDAWSKDRKRYREDTKFASGEQWPSDIAEKREAEGRPVLTVDKIGQYVRQIVNDSRQNRPAIKVRAVDDDADIETADIFAGIVRHIEDRSSADFAYDTALECAVKGGFGYFRVLTEYYDPNSFNQDIIIKRIRNPLTVSPDPDMIEPDGSDMRYCFVVEDVEKEVYEATYDKFPIDWDADDIKTSEWFGDKVRVAEYWEVKEVKKPLHLLEDGTTATDDELERARAEGIETPAIIETRQIPCREVWWSKLNGNEYLEKPRKWPGKWIPIIPVWGNEEDIDGELRHTGLYANAKDAQRLYNFSRTAFAERVALAPKAPYIAAAGQVEEYADEWNNANKTNLSTLVYDPIEINGMAVPPPRREPASDIPMGFAQDMQLSEHDIQAALGMYGASLGEQTNEKSGRALYFRQREGDTSTFHYHDNLARAIRHCGRIVVDLIPKIYDNKRVIRILGLDGTSEMAEIDPEMDVARQEVETDEGSKVIYNLNVGTYDVAVDIGPSYTTKRQEAVDAMVAITQGNPQLFNVIGDVMVRNMDWPGAEEISERLKRMLPPEMLDEEQEEIPAAVVEQIVAVQVQQAVQQVLQQVEQSKEEQELRIKEYEAETKRLNVQLDAITNGANIEEQVRDIVAQSFAELMQAGV